MKRILTSALAIVLFVGAAQAQDKPRHERKGGKFATELNLTADQQAKLKSIRESQKTEMEALKKTGSVTPEQRKALFEKYREQTTAVYTPAQKEQLNKMREEWKAKAKDGKAKGFGKKAEGRRGGKFGRKGAGFGQQAAFFKKELNLSADQETKLKGIFQDFQAKTKDLRADTNLSKEQKKEQMQSLSKRYQGQGKSVLTADQVKKLEEMKSKRKGKHNKQS